MIGSKTDAVLSKKGNLFNKINDALGVIGVSVTSIECSIEREFGTIPHLDLEIHGYETCNFQTNGILIASYIPKKIIKSEDGVATIVFWNDGTKTVVKRSKNDQDSDYDAFTAALAIKIFGSNTAVHKIVNGTTKQSKKKRKEK